MDLVVERSRCGVSTETPEGDRAVGEGRSVENCSGYVKIHFQDFRARPEPEKQENPMTDETTQGATPPPPSEAPATPPPPPEAPAIPPPPEPPPAPEVEQAMTPTGKADLGKRIIAAIIDGVIAGVAGFIPIIGGLAGAAYMLIRDGLEVDFMDQRSLGKKVMKLRPVRIDGQPMDLVTSVKRNIPFAIGPLIMIIPILGWIIGPIVAMIIGIIEIILVLTDDEGRRMGDRFAETKVIEVND